MGLVALITPEESALEPDQRTSNTDKQAFLQQVMRLSITAFGGPQVHLALFKKRLVVEGGFVSEEELMDLFGLCQILPGPTSTQTLTALAFKIGGSRFAVLALLVWLLPSVLMMTAFGFLMLINPDIEQNSSFARFLEPLALALLIHATFILSTSLLHTVPQWLMGIVAGVCSALFPSPYFSPLLLSIGGSIAAIPAMDLKEWIGLKLHIQWKYLVIFFATLIVVALLGWLFFEFRPIRLAENFYRNGALIFGGGNVLLPLMYTEFVEFKHTLSSHQFLSGLAMVQVMPGPVFAFSSYIGLMSVQHANIWTKLAGAISGLMIFLPGTFLIFFVSKLWPQMKNIKLLKLALQGINAVSCGLMVAAVFLLMVHFEFTIPSCIILGLSLLYLFFVKYPPYILVATCIIMGLVL